MNSKVRHLDVIVLVLAIIIMAAILLPLVQETNRGARRAECAAKLGELAKATFQFEMANQRYPGVLEAYGKTSDGRVKVGSWAVALFPYVEQEPLYDAWQDPTLTPNWNADRGPGDSQLVNFTPYIRLFVCSKSGVKDQPAGNSFVCNAGFFPSELPPHYLPMNPHERLVESTRPANGVFSNQLPATINSFVTGNVPMRVLGSRALTPTTRGDIADGLTQTLAFAENLQAGPWNMIGNPDGWSQETIAGEQFAGDELDAQQASRVHLGMVWLYRGQPNMRSAIVADKAGDDQRPLKDVMAVNRINGTKKITPASADTARPSSAHQGIVNAAMLGGSVMSMSESIDYHVYQSLLTPDTRKSDVPYPTYILKEEDYQ